MHSEINLATLFMKRLTLTGSTLRRLETTSRARCFDAICEQIWPRVVNGEIRPVARLEQRMAEASRLGMERMLISGHGKPPKAPKGLTVVPVKRVNEVQRVIF